MATPYEYQERVISEVDGKIDEITAIVTTKLVELNDVIAQLSANMTYQVPLSTQEFSVPGLDLTPFSGTRPTAPTLIESNPSYPSDFQLTPVSATIATFPSLDLAIPVLPTRTEPTLQELTFTATEPALNTNVPMPVMPTYTLPETYQITPVTIRAFDGLTIPYFDGVFPTDDIGTLQADFNYNDPGFASPITAALQAWIADGLANGGTGLAADIEAAMIANFRARLSEEFESAYQKEMAFFSSRRLTRAPGALRGALQEVHNQFNRKLSEASRDILIKQADLAQSNTQFIIKLAGDYEKSLQDLYNVTMARMLEAAKATVQMAVEQQNARIARYNSVLKAYEVKASVYESQIRAQMLILEAYGKELEAGKLSVGIQTLYSQLYRDQLAGIALLLDGYEKELRGAATFISLESNKLQLYQSQIQAFVARLGLDENRLKLFGMQTDTDKSQVQLWAEKIRGLGLQVEATKSQNDSNVAVANLQNEIYNKTGMESYRLQLQRIESTIKNAEAINAGRTQMFDSETKAYSADVSAYAANVDASVKRFAAETDYAIKQIEIILKEADMNQSALNSEHAIKVESLKAVLHAVAQVLSSAMSAIHTSMQLGYTGGFNAAYQPDVHKSETHEYRDYCAPSCGGTE